jgi:RNA polymerase sigma factor (sigma-70 family)
LTIQPYLGTAGVEPLAVTQGEVMKHSRRKELEAQYEDLLREFGPGLFRLVASYEYHVHIREDLLQDIRLALWTALPGFRGECSLRTFVYRIAHNRGLSHANGRRKQVSEADEPDEIIDPKSDPESTAIENAMQARLARAIRSLPLAYRQVITMTLESLPHAEIALVLGISENNVAVRLNRARILLREKLGNLK